MLKALELAGFKSFADRTRFEFPDGITVIVGPNGSGKSNIVDAMKWVLGSQSAKGLRGKEMSDVIFKGSQTRPAAGAAEATIVFDNSGGNLPVDAPEVHVTRRVYRSGESEYLINQQPVRLKDVRDLIRGTGIGIDAYSLIEQGKVDRMLQANAKDRRAIFEEAAGISRFKAKKVEAERRLARVQTNLTRLSDIVEEVGSRLKSVRSQASKAERYRQATERMKELRTVTAWSDWKELSEESLQCDADLKEATELQAQWQQRRDELTSTRQAADMQLQAIADEARACEEERGEVLQRVAALEGRREADVASVSELRLSVAKSLRRMRALKRHAGTAAEELKGADGKLADCQQEMTSIRSKAAQVKSKRDAVRKETDEILSRRDDTQRRHLASVRNVAGLESSRQRYEIQLAQAGDQIAGLQKRSEDSERALASAKVKAGEHTETLRLVQDKIQQSGTKMRDAQSRLTESRQKLERHSEETSVLRTRLEGVRQRYLVLEDLQLRQEGVSGGVRSVLEQLDQTEGTLSESVNGMVADHISADVATAPMIDAALGHRSQFLVANGPMLHEAIRSGEIKADGRVGLVRLDMLPDPPLENRIQLEGMQGVIGRADRQIQFDDRLSVLFSQLLSSTWLVDNLEVAEKVRKFGGSGQRFVTRTGEVLDNDGTMMVGPAAVAAGLVSRKSELNAAAEAIEQLTLQIADNEQAIADYGRQVKERSETWDALQQSHRDLLTEQATAQAELRYASQRLSECESKHREIQTELDELRQSQTLAKTELNRLSEQLTEGRKEIETLESEAAEIEETLSETQQALQSADAEVMSVSVEVARSEQKYESLVASIEQQRRDQSEREAAVSEALGTAQSGRTRLTELNQRIESAVSELDALEQNRQKFDLELKQFAEKAESVRESNRELLRSSDEAINKAAEASEAVHTHANRRDSISHRRETLAQRMLEDYQIDLKHDEPPEQLAEIEDRGVVDTEINRLREQLQRTSNVNMEALAELEGLQERYDHLNGQYQDLAAAKDSLIRIIGRINADSRRLFLDTLEAIRQNFQVLYRKSFGGGHADLVLEDSDDPLEAGVEILATPPGKPSFSNSLLSGGEKALTAVALLMSIFQYRPSPFCVLDEVDAPFDEANIGRFVSVLNEFLDHSKFVIVTHSKKTMTAATTLYGVTMQESGVSKRVSIRFEDVSENGEINEEEAA